MKPQELEEQYQLEARLANSVSLSVPVALQVQQLVELRKLSSALEVLNAKLDNLLVLASRPPLVEVSPSAKTTLVTKKAP